METINHEYYVSLEVAKLLKEAVFDWEVKTYYHYLSPYDEYNLEFDSISTNYNHLNNADFSAPTLDVAQRWLRDVKGIHLYVRPILDEHKYVVTVVVDDFTWGQVNDNNGISKRFNTYEEALENAIKEALKIILKKGE